MSVARRPAPGRVLEQVTLERAIGLGVLVVAALGPAILTTFWVSFVLTGAFLFGIAAASMIFLAAYGGMISLAQVSIYGIAGFVLGNVVTVEAESKGLALGWNPWVGVVLAIAIATAVGLLLGAVASRSEGIYFLMLTLVFSVLVATFFGQVTLFSGFGGVNNTSSHTPGVIGNPDLHPNRLYYAALIVALAVYAFLRYIVRTPFGIVLQGIRDDPVRMTALGYNVPLHRTLAFGLAGFVASLSGVLYVWWNNNLAPGAIGLGGVLDLLVIAVIGGLYRLEGAWLGALVFIVINDYIRDVGFLHDIGITEDRFHTAIGVIFLVIVLMSPGGLLGIWDSGRGKLQRLLFSERPEPGDPATGTGPEAGEQV